MITTDGKAPVITLEDLYAYRKIALRPTLAAICQEIFDAGLDARDELAARRVLSTRNLKYWQEFIPSALPSDWLIWAAEPCVGCSTRVEMMRYYHDALAAVQQPGNRNI